MRFQPTDHLLESRLLRVLDLGIFVLANDSKA